MINYSIWNEKEFFQINHESKNVFKIFRAVIMKFYFVKLNNYFFKYFAVVF